MGCVSHDLQAKYAGRLIANDCGFVTKLAVRSESALFSRQHRPIISSQNKGSERNLTAYYA